MKNLLIFIFLFFQVVILSAQQDVEIYDGSTELAVKPWKASFPKELPPHEVLNHIDTIRPGLYRSSVGRNFGYFTDEYYQGFFTDTETVIPFEYYFLPRDYSNYMIVKNQKAGVIDSMNNFIIPMIYSSLFPLNEKIPVAENKYMKAWKGLKLGLISLTGEVIIPIKYKNIREADPDIFIIQDTEENFGVADLRNPTAYNFTECKYNDGIKFLNKNFCTVGVKTIINNRVKRKFGCIDLKGKELAKPIYRKIELSTDENFVIAYDGVNSKIINPKGEIVYEKDSVEIKNLVKGIYTFNISRKQFVIRNNFKETIELKNQGIKTLTPDFYLDTKISKHRSQWLSSKVTGVKNYQGEEILPIEFDEIIYANDNLFFANKKDQPLFAAYNQEGKEIIPPVYSHVKIYEKNIVVRKPNAFKFAMINQVGKEITPFIYDEITFKRNNSRKTTEILAKKNGEVIVLDPNGKEIATKEKPENYRYDFYGEQFNKSNVVACQHLRGNRYRHVLENDFLIQYKFNEDSTGQKIIYANNKKGKEVMIEIPFISTVSSQGTSGSKKMLWLFFENEKIKGNNSKSILKKIRNRGLLGEMEFYPIKYNVLDKTIFSTEISTSQIDFQTASLEEKQKLKTLLEIQSKLQKEMVYQPLHQEDFPKVWIDLETQLCYLINLKSSKLQFSKVYFKDGEWYLGSSDSQDPAIEKFDSFLLFNNINYLTKGQKIVNGILKLNYKENTRYSHLMH